ncbi:MAG: hypothetical protein U0520_00025 [Candidatus Saccharimonadales bacterium]
MANPEAEVFEPFWDAAALEDSVHELGLLYGIRNLTAVIRPGAETMCIRASDGIGIVLDPMQVVTGNGDHDDDSLEAMGHSYEITALFMIGHEIGHALDYLDPQWEMPTNETKGQGFFNTLVDDTVIDRRNRRVPLFDDYADSVYGRQLPHDILSMPKHVQLMYAIRMTEVETNPDLKMDAEVRAVIDGLRAYDKDGKVFDILHTMTDPRTELAQRKKIAQEYIWPYFEQLYEEDAQNQSQGEGEGENQDGQPGDFDDIYNDYMQAVHGHGDSDHQEGQEGEGSEGDQSEGQQSMCRRSVRPKEPGEQLADALKELAEEQKAQAEARKEQAK